LGKTYGWLSFRPTEKFFSVFVAMVSENRYFVYLMTNWNDRVMYIGVTNDLTRRVYEHKNKLVRGFTDKYNVSKLVYFEETIDVRSAIAREKQIKKWRREKKDALVVSLNPEWKDLWEEGKDFSLRSK
jgi:putative endonuclease